MSLHSLPNTEAIDKEMRQRIHDCRSMLDWNEMVTLSKEGIKPLLDLAEEALDLRRQLRRDRNSDADHKSAWEQQAVMAAMETPAFAYDDGARENRTDVNDR